LQPTSTWISVVPMAVTIPVTLSPVFRVLKDFSSSSSKDSLVSGAVVLMFSSVIVVNTSIMILAGVDAPAVSPATRHPEKNSGESSSADSIWRTFPQFSLQISVKCLVLALLRSPTTTIASTLAESSAASV